MLSIAAVKGDLSRKHYWAYGGEWSGPGENGIPMSWWDCWALMTFDAGLNMGVVCL
jgi:hypothetical protein